MDGSGSHFDPDVVNAFIAAKKKSQNAIRQKTNHWMLKDVLRGDKSLSICFI
jgi:HD-GYP domain-containing protein (c-di-GMP phosphodiesterase class II)